MTKQQDTINKAFGNIPKELHRTTDMWDWIPTKRSFQYWYYTLYRKLFR